MSDYAAGSSFFERLNLGRVEVVLVALLVLCIILMTINYYYISLQSRYDRDYVALSSELRVLSQSLAKGSLEAVSGQFDGFSALSDARNRFDDHVSQLTLGRKKPYLPASPKAIQTEYLSRLQTTWVNVRDASDVILQSQKAIVDMHEAGRAFEQAVQQIQRESEAVISALVDEKMSPEQVHWATRQLWLTERITSNINTVLKGNEAAIRASDEFNRNVVLLGQILVGLRQGSELLGIQSIDNAEALSGLSIIEEVYGFLQQNQDYILNNSPSLFTARNAADQVASASLTLLDVSSELVEAYRRQPDQRFENQVIGYASAIFALAFLILLAYRQWLHANEQYEESRQQNEHNQQAILRLLDEMDALAEGDLTTEVTVSEAFTGAIADAVNYTIGSLRSLVSTISSASVQVSRSARTAKHTAEQLTAATGNQVKQIAKASNAIKSMAGSIGQVTESADESAKVAEKSLTIAKKGAEMVQNTIFGMDNIRDQIQETSKRIKRLGESSQEVGDIVSLISDISDQTNILALNAAIQAAMAGEAGRGFAVVSDEVQRLAERAVSATKQIEALVSTIQSDTKEAVISMEQTTMEVVKGAYLAQDAGVALEEIEEVSINMADIVKTISNIAGEQAQSSTQVAEIMTALQETTKQTTDGTRATVHSVGIMAELSQGLAESIAGFKLPEDEQERDV